MVFNEEELVLNVRLDGSVVVGGRGTSLPALREMLVGELARARQAGRPLRVVVRCDRRGRYGKFDDVLKTCRQAGVRRIVFPTLPEGRP